LTFDLAKAVWGPKYAHMVDTWVAYRYWQNKFGRQSGRQPRGVGGRPEVGDAVLRFQTDVPARHIARCGWPEG